MSGMERSPRWHTAAILLLPVVLAVSWTASIGYAGLNGQDAHDYYRLAKAWSIGFQGQDPPVMQEHPHGYPFTAAVLGVVFGGTLNALRLLPILAILLITWMQFHRSRKEGGSRSASTAFVLLALLLSPFLLRYAMTVMSDLPAMALILSAFWCTVNWLEQSRPRWVLLAIMFVIISVAFRLAVVPIAAVLCLALVHGPVAGRSKRWGAILVSIALVLGWLAWTYWDMDPVDRLHNSPLADWSFWNFFRTELHSDDGVLQYAVPNVVYILSVAVHPGFLPIGILLLPFVRRSDFRARPRRLAVVILAVYALFIAGMPFQNDRVLLMALPFVVVLLDPAFRRAWEFLTVKLNKVPIVIGAVALLQAGLFMRAMWPFMEQARFERSLAEVVNEEAPVRVYTHGMGAAFTTYCPKVQVIELWYEVLPNYTSGSLVVVRPGNLTEQWEGRPPARNWARIQEHGITELERTPEGWLIARLR